MRQYLDLLKHVLENGAPREIDVHVGVSDGKDTEVLSGDIKAGQQLIISSRTGKP